MRSNPGQYVVVFLDCHVALLLAMTVDTFLVALLKFPAILPHMTKNPTVALIIIGNEILSGRTKDVHIPWLGEQLSDMGLQLAEVRVVADDEAAIMEAVNALRARNAYVFTTGGIGPTHDDITAACIAKAFDVPIIRHEEAEAALRAHYKPEDINEMRLKMADVPEGATLVGNPVSGAPGFRLENVFVFAGVPSIMRAMFDNVRHELDGVEPIMSRSITVMLPEGAVAEELTKIQARYAKTDIGSYPFIKDGRLGTSLVVRSADVMAIEGAITDIRALVTSLAGEIIAEA